MKFYDCLQLSLFCFGCGQTNKTMTTDQQTALRAVLAKVPTYLLSAELINRGIATDEFQQSIKHALSCAPTQDLTAELDHRGKLVQARLRSSERHCHECNRQATMSRPCATCWDIIRTYQRNKYRMRKGIPLDMPIHTTNKRKIV